MTLNKSSQLKGISNFTIIKILKKFKQKEMSDFEKFLNSPFYNNHSTITKLFRELKKFYPQFADKLLTKEYLFEIVNPGKKYDDMLFQKYLSRMNKLAEEYLSILELRKDQNDKDLKILYQLSKRDLKDVYSRKLNEVEKNFNENLKIDDNFYLLKHKLSDIKYYDKARSNNQFSIHKDLMDSYNYLINYLFIISSSCINQLFSDKLSYKYSELDRTSGIFYNRTEIEKNVAGIIKQTPPDDKKRLLFLELILNDLKMNSGKNELNAYKNLRKIVFENFESLSNTLLLYYLKRLNLYCGIEIANGNYGLNKELFENYRFMLEKKLFFLEEIPDLRLVDYRVILSTATKINEIEWAEKFINESVSLIKEESRDNIINFGYAILMFHKKNYSGSLDHISMIQHELLPITIDIYILKSKIFYELGFLDTAKSVSDSLRHFIKNNPVLSDILKNSLRSFYNFFSALLRLNENYNEIKLKKVLSEIEGINGIWNKLWLIEKTNELLHTSGKGRPDLKMKPGVKISIRN